MEKSTDMKRRGLVIGVLLLLITAMPEQTYAQQPKLMLPIGHVGGAELTFSADSKKMLSIGNDGTAKIWDVQSGLMLADLVGHKGNIVSAEYSANGQKIITTAEDNTVKIWSISSGELLQTLGSNRGTLGSVEFYANDKLALVFQNLGEISTGTVWDVITGSLLSEINESKVKGEDGKIFGLPPVVTLSPDGKSIARSDYYNLRPDSVMLVIADTRTGVRRDTLEGFFVDIRSILYSPGGKNIIAFGRCYLDSTGKKSAFNSGKLSWVTGTWNTTTGKLLNIHKVEHIKERKYWSGREEIDKVELWFDHRNKDLLFVNDGSTIESWNILTGKRVSGLWEQTRNSRSFTLGKNNSTAIIIDSSNTLKIVDVYSGKLMGSFRHSAEIKAYQVNEKNSLAITFTTDNHIHIWDIASGKLLRSYDGGDEKIVSLQHSPYDKYLAIITQTVIEGEDEDETIQHVKIWDWSLDKFLWIVDLSGTELKAGFSPDGKSVAVHFKALADDPYTERNQDNAQILDVITGKKKSNFMGHASYVRSGAFSPDQKRIVTTYSDSTIKIWDVEKGQFTNTLIGHTDVVNMVQFNPDGSYLASASADSTVRIWDALSGKLLYTLEGSDGPVFSARFSTDSKYIVTVSENESGVWDAGTGKLLRVLKGSGGIDARFSNDGKYIMSGAKVWNAISGKLLFELDWHNGEVNYNQFSSDGKYIVTASSDETAKLWSMDYGELLYSFDNHADEVVFATFSKDNKKVITASLDNTVKVWDVQTGRLEKSMDLGPNTVVRDMHIEGNKLLCVNAGSETRILNLSTGERLYSFFAMEKNGYLVVDKFNRFDGTENARKLLYFTCNDEVIELDQVKDQLWTPGLAERIMKGDSINALKLTDLNICGLTPQVKEDSTNNAGYHFKITPRRGGLGETALYLNGIEIKRYNKSQLKFNSGSYDLVVKKSELLPYLIPGQENAVNVKAWVNDNTISSRGAIVKVSNTKDTTAVPNLYAVFVGISDYKGDELDLKYAAKDAEDIAHALSIAARKLLNRDGKEHVFTYNLTTAGGRYRLPEKTGIRKTLEEIGNKATANDILVLFFAGHGIMAGKDKKQFYFLTADASQAVVVNSITEMGISTAELTEWIKPEHIKAQKRIMIFDACNSGQAIRDFVQLGKPGQGYVAARSDESGQQIKAIEKLNSQSGMIILSASASDQNAYEMSRYSQGLLTYSLLKVMKQQPEILESGKYLDVTNWLNASKKLVGQLTEGTGARQEPQLNTNNNFNIGIIDEEVRSKILLSSEKPLFTRSNFQNVHIKIDDLKLKQVTDKEFLHLSNITNADITFSADYEGNDGYSLSGDYNITGDQVVITVLLVKGGIEIKHRYELKGATADLVILAREMTRIAVAWLKSNP